MKREDLALMYAMFACDAIMDTYTPQELPPAHGFHYHQGVFLSGMMKTWQKCGRTKYYNYLKEWVDHIIWEDGSIHHFDQETLDDLQSGILLFELYKKTNDNRYRIALDTLLTVLKNFERNEYGGFWHKKCFPNQMWLDGAYMVGPLQAEYAHIFGKPEILDQAVKQVFLMAENMMDHKTNLLYHAWDCSKQVDWANSETGLSAEIWGRSVGWYVVAILDILEHMSEEHPTYQPLVELERKVLQGVLRVQDSESGMWHQILDKGDKADNWLETSCTALFSYAIAKAVRMNILCEDCMQAAWNGFEGIIENSLSIKNGKLNIGGVCVGTGVCDYEGYIARPTSVNDLHGVGAFLLMCSELAK